MASKIVRGDDVQVIAGDHKGKKGKVLRVLESGSLVLVSGVNLRRKKVASKAGKKIISTEFPLHVSNVMLLDKVNSTRSRVGFKFFEGVKKRFYKGSGEVVA